MYVHVISKEADTGCDSYGSMLTDMLIIQALLMLSNCVFVRILYWVLTADILSITPATVIRRYVHHKINLFFPGV